MSVGIYDDWITASWERYLESLCDQGGAGSLTETEAIISRLKKSVVVSRDDIIPGRIQFGSCVTVYGIEEEEEIEFQISSDDQAEVFSSCVGISAPLAQGLLGAQEGDVVEVHMADSAKVTYEVTHVKLPSI